jgi:hypothetical protein
MMRALRSARGGVLIGAFEHHFFFFLVLRHNIWLLSNDFHLRNLVWDSVILSAI